MSKIDSNLAILVGSVALGYLINKLFYFGFGLSLYIILIALIIIILIKLIGKKLTHENSYIIALMILFGLMFTLRASFLLIFLNILTVAILFILLTSSLNNTSLKNMTLQDFLLIPLTPLLYFLPLGDALNEFFKSLRERKFENSIISHQLVKGLLLSIPILFVFIMLLGSADPIFKNFIYSIFHIELSLISIAKFISTIFFSCFFIGALSYALTGRYGFFTAYEKSQQPNKEVTDSLPNHQYLYVIISSVIVLFLAFIAIQFRYFFGGNTNINAAGYTYAEYARKGFFELILVAFIIFFLINIIESLIVKKGKNRERSFIILSIVLILQAGIIMLSSSMRLYLYETAYGFTVLRIFSHSFILLLGVLFTILLWKLIFGITSQKFTMCVMASIIGYVFILNLINPEAYIAQNNINRYKAGHELDSYYLVHYLSADAVPTILKNFDELSLDAQRDIASPLLHPTYEEKTDNKILRFNIAYLRARNAIDLKLEALELLDKGY